MKLVREMQHANCQMWSSSLEFVIYVIVVGNGSGLQLCNRCATGLLVL